MKTEYESTHDGSNRYLKKLTSLLYLSGTVNILLLLAIGYLIAYEAPPVPVCEKKPFLTPSPIAHYSEEVSNANILLTYRKLSFEELFTALQGSEKAENGYLKRDLALSALVRYHDFDLARALRKKEIRPKKMLVIGKKRDGQNEMVPLYPPLNGQDFQAVHAFIKSERWPFTAKGILNLIKQQSQNSFSEEIRTLTLALQRSVEFTTLEQLFSRSTPPPTTQELIELIKENDYSLFDDLHRQQRSLADLSDERRQRLLSDYLSKNSRTAAYLLLKCEKQYSSCRLDDHRLSVMITLLDKPTPQVEKFLKLIAASPRSENVVMVAKSKLQLLFGEKIVVADQIKPILQPALPSKNLQPVVNVVKNKEAAKETTHIVQEGDSLWKIARRYQVKVEWIKTKNQLKSDQLKPGEVLRIPAA